MEHRDLDVDSFARMIVDVLRAAEVEYMLAGSLAAAAWGQARSTMDVDVVINLPDEYVEILSGELGRHSIFVPPDIIRANIAETRGDVPISAIHGFSGNKAELFPLRPHDRLRRSALRRKQLVTLREPIGTVYVHAPEDLILYKMQYYAISRQTKHNRDIAAILASGHELNRNYIERWAEELGLLEIWREFTGG